MNAAPCISGQTYDLAVIGGLMGIAGMCLAVTGAHLIAKAARKFRAARIGAELLDACADDMETAEKAVDSTRRENEIFADSLPQFLLRVDDDYSQRRARFYDACANLNDGGARWQDVQ